MARTFHFKGGTDLHGYGYYAYIEDGSKLIIGENGPREGGTIYKGTYKDAGSTLSLLKKEAPKLYKSIVDYYTEHPEVSEEDDITAPVKNRLQEDLLALAKKYEVISGQEYVSALRANTTAEQAEHGNAYEFNRKMSETYRMMALRAGDYAEQFIGA